MWCKYGNLHHITTNFMKTYFYTTDPADKEKNVRVRMRLRDGRNINLYGVTEEYILAKYWDNSKHWIRTKADFPRMSHVISSLNKLKTFVEDKYFEDKKTLEIGREWLKEAIELYYHPERGNSDEPVTLFEFVQDFIDRAPGRLNPKTGRPVTYKQIREYNRTFHYMKEFCRKQGREYDFADIDLDFYEDWVVFLQDEGLALNTLGKKVQTLKIFLNLAAEKGYPVNRAYKSHRFKNVTEESDTIYLDTKELAKLHELDLSKFPGQERVRDIFLIGAWTGCRFSDLPQVTRQNIKDGMIHITQGKTGNKVWIPMYPVVESILEKYEFEIPAIITNQKFNEALKVIAEKAKINSPFHKRITKGGVSRSTEYPKWQLVTSHTARRSFATNLYKSGFPSISIMQITGHKTETAFLKYIKVTPEEHAKLLQMHWQKNSDHLRVV